MSRVTVKEEPLRAIAFLLGYRHGDRGSLTSLLDGVAMMELAIVPSGMDLGQNDIRRVTQVLVALSDCVAARQPYWLNYRTSRNQVRSFKCRHGALAVRESRFWIETWVDDVPEDQIEPDPTAHNRSFLLSRVLGIRSDPTDREWVEKLGTLKAVFQLSGISKELYKSVASDSVEWRDATIVVTRMVEFPVWFLRECFSYGADCKILSPSSLVTSAAKQLSQASSQYQETLI